jgi:drug/metabolite transporter (DMT)-like permease
VLFSVVFAWLLLSQLPSGLQLVGGVVLVAGVLLVRAGEPPVGTRALDEV